MKPEELMIGDIVNVHRCECVADGGQFQEWDEYGKVVSITEYYITIKYIGGEEDYGFEDVYGEDINPIPLTPEIFEKNGFENDFYHDESVADYHFVRLEGYSYREDFILVTWCNGELNVVNDLIGEVKIHCENIHELQHALRLCGIDKEIEI